VSKNTDSVLEQGNKWYKYLNMNEILNCGVVWVVG